MGNLVQFNHAHKGYGLKTLFKDESFSIDEGEHVGVIGPNGAGKTTLFKALTGEEALDSGQITRARTLKLGYLPQHDNWNLDETVEEYLVRYCTVPIWDLKQLALELGLSNDMFSRRIGSLSGGYRMRCKLLYLIGIEPNLMLLDEPTNYLDLETLLVLEKFLQNYRGGFLLISHDREFLRKTTDHILEVEAGEITKYPGHIDDYFEQKELLRHQLEKRAMTVEAKRKEVLDFVARFGASATKASQAQSRLKSLGRLEKVVVKQAPVRARIRIPAPIKTGKSVLRLDDVALGYKDQNGQVNEILKDIQFEISAGDHVAIVGLNGAGKSTFLKGLSGILEPLRGQLKKGHQVEIAHFAQHLAESLKDSETVYDAMARAAHKEVRPQDILDLAGSLLFSGDDVRKRVGVLSGGEKSRVALGQVLLSKAPCLLLDEPTNHLDFDTVEALTQALQSYEGTVLVVSHDRSFMARMAKKILWVHDGRIDLFPGDYDEYLWSLQKGALNEFAIRQNSTGSQTTPAKNPQKNASPGIEKSENTDSLTQGNFKEEKSKLEKELRRLSKEVEQYEARLVALARKQEELADKMMSVVGQEAAAVAREAAAVQDEMHATESKWFESSDMKQVIQLKIDRMVGR